MNLFFSVETNMPQIPTPLRLTFFSAVVGVALIGALAIYFRRRKRRKANVYTEIYIESKTVETVGCDRSNVSDSDRSKRRMKRMVASNGGLLNSN